jgi:hypothetical protein
MHGKRTTFRYSGTLVLRSWHFFKLVFLCGRKLEILILLYVDALHSLYNVGKL